MLFAQLVDDPSAHPDRFPTPEAQDEERERLFDIIRRLVPWEAASDEKVLEEATRLFYERGFQGASIDAIAERLSVTKPFIYTYFDNKHALLEAIYERAVQNLILGAKARAALLGSYMVRLEDLQEVAAPVLTHRIITTSTCGPTVIESTCIVQNR